MAASADQNPRPRRPSEGGNDILAMFGAQQDCIAGIVPFHLVAGDLAQPLAEDGVVNDKLPLPGHPVQHHRALALKKQDCGGQRAVEIAQFAGAKGRLLGLRYEPTVDQLRYLLAELRRMLHAHPRINSETVRVRFWGYGMSEIKVNVRVHAATREWNDFFAIREDVYFRIFDIVREAGTDFALESQTLFLGRDPGTDTDKTQKVEDTVESWRKSGDLPFPRLRPEELEQIDGALDEAPRVSRHLIASSCAV